MDSKLERIKRRETLWDRATVGFMVLFLIGAFIVLYRWQLHVENELVNVIAALVPAIFLGYPVMHLVKYVDKFVRRRWITSYYIEEEIGVLKVVGSVPLTDWGVVKSRLLERRPSYRIVDDAYERFGCTMAAVPASDLYLAARQELAANGLAI